MIIITGQIFTDAATLPDLFARLQSLCEASRAEDGCLFYHMGMEDAEQGIIMAMEGWRDQMALDAHLAVPSVKRLLDDFAGKFRNDVQIHQVSDSQRFSL